MNKNTALIYAMIVVIISANNLDVLNTNSVTKTECKLNEYLTPSGCWTACSSP